MPWFLKTIGDETRLNYDNVVTHHNEVVLFFFLDVILNFSQYSAAMFSLRSDNSTLSVRPQYNFHFGVSDQPK